MKKKEGDILNEKISKNITIISFIMTCIIICYHASYLGDPVINIDASLDLIVNDVLGDLSFVAMNFFFFTTGFMLFRNLSFSSYIHKITKRISTLLVPYLIWQILFFLLKFAVLRQSATYINFFNTVFLFEQWPPNGPLWYLYIAFLLAILSPVILLIYKNIRLAQLFLIIVMLFSNYSLASETLSNGSLSNTFIPNIINYLPGYIIGTYFGYYHSNNVRLKDLSSITMMLILAMIFNDDGNIANIALEGILKKTTLAIIPMLLVYTLPESKYLKLLANIKFTFLMYVLHPAIIALVEKPVYYIIFKHTHWYSIANICTIVVSLSLTATVSGLLYYLLKKHMPKILHILTGGRCK